MAHEINVAKNKVSNLEDYESLQLELCDVLPNYVSGLPPKRNIDFTIDIVLGFSPVLKVPYHNEYPKLLELKMQLEELLENKYIRLIVFPRGVEIIFVKNKYGNINLYINYRKLNKVIVKSMYPLP